VTQNIQGALFLTVCATALAWAATAQAGLTLAVPSATFYTTDGTDTLDVMITGDGSTSFGALTLSFAITADSSNASTPLQALVFQSPAGPAALGPALPGYVFSGNSLDLAPPPSPFVSALGAGDTQLTVADSTADFSDVVLANGTKALLAELIFAVPTNITNSGGDKFDVTLLDPNMSPTALQSNVNTPSDVPVTGTFTGVVTVEAPGIAPVPEAGTFGMLLAGATGLFLVKRRNRSTRQQKTVARTAR
jgi:hypothetical protein